MAEFRYPWSGVYPPQIEEDMQRKQEHHSLGMVATFTNPYLLPFKRFDKTLPALFKEDQGNAGFDLFARLEEPVILQPGQVATIPLNVATKIQAIGVGLLFQRSSTFRKWGVRLTNGVGVIDSLFSGNEDEWGAEFQNMTSKGILISNGDKVCQAVFLPLLPVLPTELDSLDEKNRGGFGTSFDKASELKW